ncbi:hypothetical protein [Algoriphagus confluentis]|uniref:HEAT repeat domain-containing protein n=1 Tax=Algoriphagus confluentis TaxID=1697556 RepID=A0ABQ6PMP3_9BACT|nr:hypothetical protein Aconfl_10610 [Algoriphagus confluentis]
MKKAFLGLLLLFCLICGRVSGQDVDFLSSYPNLEEFLIVQEAIPGLGFQVYFPQKQDEKEDSLLLGKSWLPLMSTDSGKLTTLSTELALLQFLPDTSSQVYALVYSVYSSPTTRDGAEEYLSTLIRNRDFFPKDKEILPESDWVALAYKVRYSPFFKNAFTYFLDFKLIGVTFVILFFLASAFFIIVFMLIYKSRKNKKEELIKEYDQLVVDPLTTLLFEKEIEEIEKMGDQEINQNFNESLLSKPLYQQVLISRIIGLNKKMKGEFKGKLKALYIRTGLVQVTMRKLRSKKWHQIAEGLVEVNEMDLRELLQEVKRFTNSSNYHVRSLSVAALLNLSEKSDLSFLRDQTYPLSDWQQMNFLRIIRFVDNQRPLNLSMLFDSKNGSIRIFAIRLVRMLGKTDLIGELSRHAHSMNDEEKIETLKTYQELGAHMEIDFINSCLGSTRSELLIPAGKAAAILGNEESVRLIRRLLEEKKDFRTQRVLLNSLKELDQGEFEYLVASSRDEDFKRIGDHLKDPLLAHV